MQSYCKTIFVLAVFLCATCLGAGCSHMEMSSLEKNSPDFINGPLGEASRKVDEARAIGKDVQCPEEFKDANDMVAKAYNSYDARHPEGSIAMAQEAINELDALCPPKAAIEPSPSSSGGSISGAGSYGTGASGGSYGTGSYGTGSYGTGSYGTGSYGTGASIGSYGTDSYGAGASGTGANRASSAPNYAVVKVYYATDRKESFQGNNVTFRNDRSNVTYGACQVSIPRDHRMGMLEAPSIFRFEFRENPDNHVVLLDTTPLKYTDFMLQVKSEVLQSAKKSALVFIHGYNVTFSDAARRTAQMKYDLGFNGAAIFFSWPSKGKALEYPADEAVVEFAQIDIKSFLHNVVKETNVDNIYIIAHSMGNRAMTRALVSLMSENPQLKTKFKEVILAAPDIDADVFTRDIAPALTSTSNHITMYASSKDKALAISKGFHSYRRAGDSNPTPLIVNGIDTIDATNVDTSFLGHSYWVDNISIISDIYYLINENLSPSSRVGLKPISSPAGQYWMFSK